MPVANSTPHSSISSSTTSDQVAVRNMVLLNALGTPLMLSAANVALPSIATALNMNALLLSWVPLAFLMASAMFILIFGRLADMVGRKRIYLLGSFFVIVASIGAACATSGPMLLLFRFLQGASTAMLYATQVALVSSVYSASERGKYIGIVASTLYFGLTCGPLVGGFLVEWIGWRIVFLIHLPLSFAVLYFGLFKVKGEWKAPQAGTFDYPGAIFYMLTILTFGIGVSLFSQWWGYFCLAVGGVLLFAFIKLEQRSSDPLLDLRLFLTNRVFARACFASFIMYSATFANVVLVSLYLQYIRGIDAALAGVYMMIQPLAMSLFSPVAGKMSDRFGASPLVLSGMGLNVLGLTLMTQFSHDTSLLYVSVALFISGVGVSLFSSPNINAMMGAVEPPQYGIASGVNSTMRIIGQLSSMVIVTLMMSFFLGAAAIAPDNYPLLEKVIVSTFTLAAGLCILGFILSLPRRKLVGMARS